MGQTPPPPESIKQKIAKNTIHFRTAQTNTLSDLGNQWQCNARTLVSRLSKTNIYHKYSQQPFQNWHWTPHAAANFFTTTRTTTFETLHTEKDEESCPSPRAKTRETMLGKVGDDQHISPPRLCNNLVHSIFIDNRRLPFQREICNMHQS